MNLSCGDPDFSDLSRFFAVLSGLSVASLMDREIQVILCVSSTRVPIGIYDPHLYMSGLVLYLTFGTVGLECLSAQLHSCVLRTLLAIHSNSAE